MEQPLYVITGAPGAGKSTTLAAFRRLQSPLLAFDMDWLLAAASHLAGKAIRTELATWPAYNALWFEIVGMIVQNHQRPLLFSRLDPQDLMQYSPSWWTRVESLLLDCADPVRRLRLQQRPGWTEAMIEEALHDAASLRQTVPTQVDTGNDSPE
jgi:hypothetical protein